MYLNSRTSDDHPYPLAPICTAIGQDIYQCWYYHPLVIILEISLLVFILLEVFEIIKTGTTNYFMKMENNLQLTIAILTLTFIFSAPKNMELANHCGAWAVFLTWSNLTQLLARFEFFGLGIFMALHVAEKIIKTMLVFTTSFLAFIFGFNMLFQANPAFHGIIGTGVKIFVMMQGEFNFDDNLGYQNVHEHGGRNVSIQVKKTFKHTESKENCNTYSKLFFYQFQILFFLYLIWMVLIFMNLLVGLTVTSIDKLKKTGTIMQAKKRVDDILLLSKILPKNIWPDNLMTTKFTNPSKKVYQHKSPTNL